MSLLSRSALLLVLLLAGCASTPVSSPQARETLPAAEAQPPVAETTAPEASGENPPTVAAADKVVTTDEKTSSEDGRKAGKNDEKSEEKSVPPVDKAGALKALARIDDSDVMARGKASYYHIRFSGRRTANGQHYNDKAMTAAHRTLPFGTTVRVTNVRNGRSVVVTINDRGPFLKSRIIDLSGAAARALGLMHHGVGEVVLSRP